MAGLPPFHPGDLVRIRGERWRIARYLPFQAAAIIEVEGSDAANQGAQTAFLLPCELLDRLPVSSAPKVVRPARWRHLARRALADALPPRTSLRTVTRANLTLIPFQLEPALALARGDGCRFLIADAVGMGKTIQAGLMMAETLHRHPEGRVLAVVPAGLRDQWRDELRSRFALEAEVLDAVGVARAAAHLPAGLSPWSVCRLAITSIDYLKRPEVIRCHEALIWDLVVFDEAHALAGRSDRGAAAAALGNRARIVVMLTATPHSGDDLAFQRMCRIGDLQDGHPLLLFRRTRANTGMAGLRRTVLLRVRPSPAEAVMHRTLTEYARLVWTQSAGTHSSGAHLAMSVLMRRAASSAASLARSVERRLALLATPSATQLMQPLLPFPGSGSEDEEPETLLGVMGLHDALVEHRYLRRLLDLARDAARAESKLAALRRLLSRTDEPAIVFTEYRDTLHRLASALPDVDLVELHGGLGARERMDALRRFTTGAARLLLATDAASEGLNLHQRCRLVVNLELPWTPLRLEQRAGRVDRIGQQRRVHALHLVATGTSEESVLARLARRVTHMQSAMSALGQLPDEHDVAECVFADRAIPERAPSTGAPVQAGIRVPDLGSEARAEAARIAEARATLRAAHEATGESRPLLTRLRRRDPSHCRTVGPSRREPRLFWLFRLLFTGENGRVVWESVLPIGAVAAPTNATSASVTRMLLDPHHQDLQRISTRAQEEQLHSLRSMLQQPVHVWGRRERALMDALREHQARLAAGLLQRGLFERRHERLAAAQSALIDEAAAASAARMAELSAYEHLRVASCDLVFGIALD